jgi:hypothetical protein
MTGQQCAGALEQTKKGIIISNDYYVNASVNDYSTKPRQQQGNVNDPHTNTHNDINGTHTINDTHNNTHSDTHDTGIIDSHAQDATNSSNAQDANTQETL